MSEQPETGVVNGGAAGVSCQRSGCAGAYASAGGGELVCGVCGLPPVVTPGGMLGAAPTGLTVAGRDSRSSASSSRSSGRASVRSRASRRSVSGRIAGVDVAEPSARTVSVRSSRSAGTGSARGRLGAGLVAVPEVPKADPGSVVLPRPEVPEHKRFCSSVECGAPVGRARGGRTGRTEGFCTKCGHPYSFVPKLRAGDVVHGQYEIAGCLAHGGLGWVYLAVDRAVSDRWVVLKGLLDTGDEEAMAAAISERRFLAEIEHANIVRIYNFVEHLDSRTGSLDGYIVMEYVGGKSLKQIANERRTPAGRRDPLPVGQACAYGIEALEALGHLHSRNLLYCDFKADNAIQQNDQLKLIDMGAVRRMDDDESPVYGTLGYQAPEVVEEGASVASDLYTVARTLAVLTFDFQGYMNVFADSLPDPRNIPVFQQYESFYRFLVRATDPDPQRRFSSAEEMSEQLLGVLREVVALQTGRPRPAMSTLFGAELRVADAELLTSASDAVSALGARTRPEPGLLRRGRRVSVPGQRSGPAGPAGGAVRPKPLRARAAALALPVPRVDSSDPNAGFLAGLIDSAPGEILGALQGAPADSRERRLRELRARLESGTVEDGAAAAGLLSGLTAEHPDDWRVVWYRGVGALAAGDRETAALSFEAVYDAFPGESAPKLALAVCAEALGQLDNATEYYRLVWTTDPAYVSAAFGLARVCLAVGDRRGAVEALESVPEVSIHYTAARVAAVRARLRQRAPHEPLSADLHAAAEQTERLEDVGLDALRREELTTEVLGCALDWVLAGRSGAPPAPAPGDPGLLLGCPLDEEGLRFGLERGYRRLARLAQSGTERIEMVERANRFRPRTWM